MIFLGKHSDWLIEHTDDVFCEEHIPEPPNEYETMADYYAEMHQEKIEMEMAAQGDYIYKGEREAMKMIDEYEAKMWEKEKEEMRIERIKDEAEHRQLKEWEEERGERLYEEFQSHRSPGCLGSCLGWLACVTVVYIVGFIFICIFNSLGVSTY